MADEGKASTAAESALKANGSGDYWQWDECRWGTHGANCVVYCPFRVYVKDGKVVREEISCSYPEFQDPNYRLPDCNPRGCQKGHQHARAMYGRDRVLYPMKREAERGSGKWQRISWEQAFDEIGGKVADVIQTFGPQALLDDHGTMVRLVRGGGETTMTALISLLGGVSLDVYTLAGDFHTGQYLTLGQQTHMPGVENWFLADTLVLFHNAVYNTISDMHYMLEARYRGAKVVVIAPDKNPTAQFADLWLPINWSADSALWLGVCRNLIERGWINESFLKEKTDAPVLVRRDDGRFLRESDLREAGDSEQFYVVDNAIGMVEPLPKGTLRTSLDYALEGRWKVRLKEGSEVEVTTVFTLLKQRVAEYTPGKVHELAGIHPEHLERLTELCRPPRKVFVSVMFASGKLYHGDLLERSYCYMLALTGNFGKPGTGTRAAGGGAEFSCTMPMICNLPRAVLESPEPMLEGVNLLQMATEDYKTHFKMDPTMPPAEAAGGALREALRASGTIAPPAFFWYYHAGYKEVWDKFLDDPHAVRKVSDYAEEAIARGWWKGWDRPAKDVTPKVMFVSSGNPLRRHRGGMNTYLKTLWPKLDLIVNINTRWSTTALLGDYILPAASYYEYADGGMALPDNRYSPFSDQSVTMLGESKSDRQIVLGLLRSVQAHLKKRRIAKYKSGDREIIVDEIYWRATYGGRYGDSNEDEERLVDDAYRVLGELGWYTSLDGNPIDLANVRRNGMAQVSGRPISYPMVTQGADMVANEVHYSFRDQVELGVPYATTTRRIEFYLDHPWFIEADEHLVRYKRPPSIGGHQPLKLTTGHLRWSIHSNWITAEEMLKLHRGEPFAFINRGVAEEKGITDNDYIRVFNDYGEFLVTAKPSACVRPDQLIIYHAWEPYQYPNWRPYDGLLPGPPKGIHFAGGYRPYEYIPLNWAPQQLDRQTSVAFERAEHQSAESMVRGTS